MMSRGAYYEVAEFLSLSVHTGEIRFDLFFEGTIQNENASRRYRHGI